MLPSATKGASFAQVVSELSALADEECVKMAARVTQGLVAAVSEVVANMTRGLSPERKVLDSNDFWKRVALRLVMFCEWIPSAGAEGSAPVALAGVRPP